LASFGESWDGLGILGARTANLTMDGHPPAPRLRQDGQINTDFLP
jgi:hypothetical protein